MNAMKMYIWGICAAMLFIIIVVTGNVITIGEKISIIHPFFANLFYIIIGAIVIWLIIIPVAKILMTPQLDGLRSESIAGSNLVAKEDYLKRLKNTIKLTKDEKVKIANCVNIEEMVCSIVETRFATMEKIIKDSALSALMITAISQNGKFDFISSVIININMINKLIKVLGIRPSYRQLLRLYISVFTTSIITQSIDEIIQNIDVGSLLGMTSTKILNVAVTSATDGIMNGFVTLRIGYATMEYLDLGSRKFKGNNVRKDIYKKALKNLPDVAKQGMNELTDRLKNTLNKAININI